MLPSPDVVACAGAWAGAAVVAAGVVDADESPNRPADVEPTVTGTVTGATICVPEAMPSDPLVLAACPVGAGAAVVAGPVAVEPPSRPTDDGPRFMGAVTGATTCVPEATDDEPSVVGLVDAPCAGAAAGAVDVADESPKRPKAVDPTLMGAVTGATTCVPERTPSWPLVSAAFAAVAPTAIRPPAKHVPMRHLRNVAFIVIFS